MLLMDLLVDGNETRNQDQAQRVSTIDTNLFPTCLIRQFPPRNSEPTLPVQDSNNDFTRATRKTNVSTRWSVDAHSLPLIGASASPSPTAGNK